MGKQQPQQQRKGNHNNKSAKPSSSSTNKVKKVQHHASSTNKNSKKKKSTKSPLFSVGSEFPEIANLLKDKNMQKELLKMVSIVDEESGKSEEISENDLQEVVKTADKLASTAPAPSNRFNFLNVVNTSSSSSSSSSNKKNNENIEEEEEEEEEDLMKEEDDEEEDDDNEGFVAAEDDDDDEDDEDFENNEEDDDDEEDDGMIPDDDDDIGESSDIIIQNNEDDDDEEEEDENEEEEEEESKNIKWNDMHLDGRILGAIKKLKFDLPTTVQQKTIPQALKGRDIIAKAATGTGKTIAFAIPAINTILEEYNIHKEKKVGVKMDKGVRVIVIAPTEELAQQIEQEVKKLTCMCNDICPILYLGSLNETTTNNTTNATTASGTSSNYQNIDYKIVIGTPDQLLKRIKKFVVKNLKLLIIDEADLVLDKQFKQIKQLITSNYLPNYYQCIMMSATLNPTGLDELKSYLLKNNYTSIDCSEEKGTVHEFYIETRTDSVITREEIHKLLLTHNIIRYKCLHQKVLIFVNTVDSAFLVYMGLKKMGIKDCVVLSPEYPILSRFDIMDRFNKSDEFNVLITVDEILSRNQEEVNTNVVEQIASKAFKNAKDTVISQYMEAQVNENEQSLFNIARGIDFKNVVAVINFDVPPSFENYVHRCGRAGRGGKTGIAITFVSTTSEKQVECWRDIISNHKQIIPPYEEVNNDSVNRLLYRFSEIFNTQVYKLYLGVKKQLLQQEISNAIKLKKKVITNTSSSSSTTNTITKGKVKHSVDVKGNKDIYESLPSYLYDHADKDFVGFVFETSDSFIGVLESKTANIMDFIRTLYKLKQQQQQLLYNNSNGIPNTTTNNNEQLSTIVKLLDDNNNHNILKINQIVIFLYTDDIGKLGFPKDCWTTRFINESMNDDDELKKLNDDDDEMGTYWIRSIQDTLSKIQIVGRKLIQSGPSQTELFLNSATSIDLLPKYDTIQTLADCPFAFTLDEFIATYDSPVDVVFESELTHPHIAEEEEDEDEKPEKYQHQKPIILQGHKLGLAFWCLAQLYQSSFQLFQQAIEQNNWEQIMKCSRALLIINGDCFSAWNTRRKVLLLSTTIKMIEDEFKFTSMIATKHPKSSELWFHRRWLLHQLVKLNNNNNVLLSGEMVKKEMQFCTRMSVLYPRNYYAWTYRKIAMEQFVCQQQQQQQQQQQLMKQVLEEELHEMNQFMRKNISDYSCMHFIQYLLQQLLLLLFKQSNSNNSGKYLLIHQLFWNQIFLYYYPGHEALWCHRRWLFMNFITTTTTTNNNNNNSNDNDNNDEYEKIKKELEEDCKDEIIDSLPIPITLQSEIQMINQIVNDREMANYEQQYKYALAYLLWIIDNDVTSKNVDNNNKMKELKKQCIDLLKRNDSLKYNLWNQLSLREEREG